MLKRTKKFGLGNGNPQNRHLQARKPDPYGGWNAVFSQDGLKHQRDHFNRGFFDFGGSCTLELAALLAQRGNNLLNVYFPINHFRAASQHGCLRIAASIGRSSNCLCKLWRCLRRACVIKPCHMIGQHALEVADHALRTATGPCQWRGPGLHTGFFMRRMA